MKRCLLSFVLLLFATLSPVYAQRNLADCEGLLQTRLNGGMYAYALAELPAYELASASSPQVGTVSQDTQVYITSAPTCAEGIVWYQARFRPLNGQGDFPFGFIAEGIDGNYTLEPVVQTISLPSSRQAMTNENIINISRVVQLEFGGIDQTSWSATGQYWMINSVGANWVYDVTVDQNTPLRFTQNPYDTNGTHGMVIRDSEFLMIGSVPPTSGSGQFGISSFSLTDGTALASQTLIDANYNRISVITADGRLAAAGNWSGDIFLFDVATGTLRSQLIGHSRVGILQFSPDGRYLLSVGGSGMSDSDPTVRVWDVATGGQIAMLDTGETDTATLAGFTPDSSQVFIKPPNDARLNFYSPELRLVNSIELPTFALSSLAFSADGSVLAIATRNPTNRVAFYDMNAGRVFHSLSMPATVWSLAFSPDMSLLAIAHDNPDNWGPSWVMLWAVTGQ